MMRALQVGLAALAIVLAGAGAANAETVKVTIKNIAFGPASVSARVGDTIEWTNDDIVGHTATARDKSFDFMMQPKKSARLTLKKAGEFDYYCKLHPNMTGHISVKP
jgi:plastocyanin